MNEIEATQLYRLLNIGIATATNIGSIYLIVVMTDWTKRLRHSRTDLRPLIFSLVIAKAAVFVWSGLNILNMVVFRDVQPLITIPARILFLVAILIQISVTVRLRPAPVLPLNLTKEFHSDGRVVLIVDDNVPLARIYRRCLESAGIDAAIATSGVEALEIVSQEKPRLMIIDLALPDMDGVELAIKLRAVGYEGPMVAVSGVVSLIDAEKLATADFVQVLQKPIRADDLVSLVHCWAVGIV